MKAIKLLVAGAAIMAAGFAFSGNVSADGTARSTAEVEIREGDLVLETVPDLKFSNVGVRDVVNGNVRTELSSGYLNIEDPVSEGDAYLAAVVGDYRDFTGDWTLSARMEPFIGVNGPDLILATMSLTPRIPGFIGTVEPTTVIGSTNTLLVTASIGGGRRLNEITFDSREENFLMIPRQENVRKGVYQAAMTWTLSAAP